MDAGLVVAINPSGVETLGEETEDWTSRSPLVAGRLSRELVIANARATETPTTAIQGTSQRAPSRRLCAYRNDRGISRAMLSARLRVACEVNVVLLSTRG